MALSCSVFCETHVNSNYYVEEQNAKKSLGILEDEKQIGKDNAKFKWCLCNIGTGVDKRPMNGQAHLYKETWFTVWPGGNCRSLRKSRIFKKWYWISWYPKYKNELNSQADFKI